MNINPLCICPTCKAEITPSKKEAGVFLIQFKKKQNSNEHMKRISKLGVEARKNAKINKKKIYTKEEILPYCRTEQRSDTVQ